MPCIRPATPGFIVTLVATVLLAVVSFCVPYFKSVYFLRADFSVSGHSGSITFGTLGYCLELSNGTTCSSPSIGYQLGNNSRIQIPQVAVKWLTYALFLHVIGLALAAISAIFGLLAHVREMSMACCSTCISGFAAVVTLAAFVFDIVLFFIARARINAVGHASMGNAIWLTLAAWVLLFFSGCFFTLGRCCISKRGPRSKWGNRGDDADGPDAMYSEQMRMEAIKDDNERRAMQAKSNTQRSGGLPAFYESVPLTGHIEGNPVYTDKDDTPDLSTPTAVGYTQSRPGHGPAGYAPAPQGSRAVDEYYHPSTPSTATNTTYPPRPERQASTYSHATTAYSAGPRRQPSGYTPSSTPYSSAPPRTSPPPQNNQYLPTAAYQDPYTASGREYGHAAGGSSYHTATIHDQQPSSYSYNNYSPQPQPQTSHYAEPSFNPDVYNNTGILNSASPPPLPSTNTPNPYTAPSSNPYPPATPNPHTSFTSQPQSLQSYGAQRQYTLGGDGYGGNSVPPLPEENSPYLAYSGTGVSSGAYMAPINANTGYIAPSQSNPTEGYQQPPEEAPPGYDAGVSGVTGHWGKHS